MYFQRKPSVIATGNMIALRPRILALAFFNASKLLQFTMKAFHIPANAGPRTTSTVRAESGSFVITQSWNKLTMFTTDDTMFVAAVMPGH